MTQFKVGDRVQTVKGKHPYMAIDGEKGVIVSAYVPGNMHNRGVVLVKFGDGHTLGFHEHEIQIVDEPRKILITHKDNIVTARLLDGKKTIKSAEAKCAAGDTFSFDVGAALAFDRLTGRAKAVDPQDKPQSVKLYCVKPLISWLTKGKVYESVDGWMTVDSDVNHTDKFMISDGYLVPLVARPAQVGEYVLLDGVKEPLQVTCICLYGCVILSDMRHTSGWPYLVLDGYKPQAKDTTAECKPAPDCANCANWRAK